MLSGEKQRSAHHIVESGGRKEISPFFAIAIINVAKAMSRRLGPRCGCGAELPLH